MRIGFITYEYPPDIPQGGIATYVMQAAALLNKRGHHIEIFCGSNSRTISEEINGVPIHRVLTADPAAFKHDVVSIFSARHHEIPFDVIECPEIHANALIIKEKFPALPLVVKLHMPLFLQMRLFNFYTGGITKLRFFIGALRRGRVRRYGSYNFREDQDYMIARAADALVSPSQSLKKIISEEWQIDEAGITVIPYPFEPSDKLLRIPVGKEVKKIVSFVGKLNVHKGLVNLVKAVPLVAKKHPDVVFNLVGNDGASPEKGIFMSQFIRARLKGYEQNYIIQGGLPYEEIVHILEETAVCVFPSIWENFPLVCLEAMSAGRAVVGSREGGMNEMLADGAGVLTDPLNSEQLASLIITLLSDKILCHKYGSVARTKVLQNYNAAVIGEQLENHFAGVIAGKI